VLEAGAIIVLSVLARVLTKIPKLTASQDVAGQGFRLPRQDLQRAGLAGAVATYDADLVSWVERERQPFDNGKAACFDREVTNLEGAHGNLLRGPRVAG
jgi:hypothetical protein